MLCVDAPDSGGLNPELMSPPLRRMRVLSTLLLCALMAAPLAAEAQSRKGGRRAKRKAPTEVKVTPPKNDPVQETSNTSQSSGAVPSRGPTRIDFDDRLVQGQTNKSGAVYLYDRKELKQRSMVKVRESFREEIVQTVYDR